MCKEEIKTRDLREMFLKDYHIILNDNDYDEITTILDKYDVKFTEVNFVTATSVENYINLLTQYRKMTFKRRNLYILFGEILYELEPTFHLLEEDIESNYPHHIRHKLSINDEHNNCNVPFQKNIALLRELEIKGSELSKETVSMYTFIIYNSELDIRAGIKFEKV